MKINKIYKSFIVLIILNICFIKTTMTQTVLSKYYVLGSSISEIKDTMTHDQVLPLVDYSLYYLSTGYMFLDDNYDRYSSLHYTLLTKNISFDRVSFYFKDSIVYAIAYYSLPNPEISKIFAWSQKTQEEIKERFRILLNPICLLDDKKSIIIDERCIPLAEWRFDYFNFYTVIQLQIHFQPDGKWIGILVFYNSI